MQATATSCSCVRGTPCRPGIVGRQTDIKALTVARKRPEGMHASRLGVCAIEVPGGSSTVSAPARPRSSPVGAPEMRTGSDRAARPPETASPDAARTRRPPPPARRWRCGASRRPNSVRPRRWGRGDPGTRQWAAARTRLRRGRCREARGRDVGCLGSQPWGVQSVWGGVG